MTATSIPRLRIESIRGAPVNEYRIVDGRVEFRTADVQGRWRVLSQRDVQLHHALDTVVSRWLRVRHPAEPAELKRAA